MLLQYLFKGTSSEAQIFNILISKIQFTSMFGAFIFENLLMLPVSFADLLFSPIVLLSAQCSLSFEEGHVAQTVKFCL